MTEQRTDAEIIADIKTERDRRRRRQKQQQRKSAAQVLPPPSAPMAVARLFIEQRCLYDNDREQLTVRYWCGSWWSWHTSHWAEVEERTVRALLYAFTDAAVYLADNGMPRPWSPTRRKIGDLLEALSAQVILSGELEQPSWLDGRTVGPVVAMRNGLLDIAARRLHAHTPLYFGQVSVPFDYDPQAPPPNKWLAFLGEVWPDEPEAADALAEWFGYVISGRLDLHKILLMVGPTRGGKGVIARILTSLIGKRSVCGPTLSSLGGEFGLAPLLGKSLAVISDARFVGKKGSVVVERMLSVSGEDTLTVNRKYREQWSGKLPVRLHVISNELPGLGDASTAIVGRFVPLLTTRSWIGKENHDLEMQLGGELPGILNWALDGLRRLTFDNGNRFTRQPSAEEAITAMRDLASPVAAFVRERCILEATLKIAVDDIYAVYKIWCGENEYLRASKHVFGRDLRAACPLVRKSRSGPKKARTFDYLGIGWRKKDEGEDSEELPL